MTLSLSTCLVSFFVLSVASTPSFADGDRGEGTRYSWEKDVDSNDFVGCFKYEWDWHFLYPNGVGRKPEKLDECRRRLGHLYARMSSARVVQNGVTNEGRTDGSGECWDISPSHQKIVRAEDTKCHRQDEGNGFVYFGTEEPKLEGIVTWTLNGTFEQYTPEFQHTKTYKTLQEIQGLANVIYVAWGSDGRCTQYSSNWSWLGWPVANRYCVGTQGMSLGLMLVSQNNSTYPVCRYYSPPMPWLEAPAGVLINMNQFAYQTTIFKNGDVNSSDCDSLKKEYADYAKERDDSIAVDQRRAALQSAAHQESVNRLEAEITALTATLAAQTKTELAALRARLVAQKQAAKALAKTARAAATAVDAAIKIDQDKIALRTADQTAIAALTSDEMLAAKQKAANDIAHLNADKARLVDQKAVLDANATRLEQDATAAEQAEGSQVTADQQTREGAAAKLIEARRARLNAQLALDDNARQRDLEAHKANSRETKRDVLNKRLPVSWSR